MTRARRHRGAVSVFVAVSALLLFCFVLAIAATGQRLLQREIVQDSADAASLAGAVVAAKALNYIAFVNLVMAVLLAIAIFLKGVVLGLTIFIPIASGLCDAEQYDYCSYLPTAAHALEGYQRQADFIEQQLSDLARGEREIAQLAPALAVAQAYAAGTNDAFQRNYGSGLSVQTVPPGTQSLPVTDDSASDFDEHALVQLPLIEGLALPRLWRALAGAHRPHNDAYGLALMGVSVEEAMAAGGAQIVDALPLKLADGWKDRRFFRVQSTLSQSGGAARIRRVALAARQKPTGAESSTAATAQAEFFALEGHEDLWHMNWRARLSLSQPFVPVAPELRPFWVH